MYLQTATTNPRFLTFNTTNKSKGWKIQLDQLIDGQTLNQNLNNEFLSKKFKISIRQFIRKVNFHTGMSPQRYIRERRLKNAYHLLVKGEYKTVKKTANVVGYKNVSYFIKQFENLYGKKPLQVLQENGWR